MRNIEQPKTDSLFHFGRRELLAVDQNEFLLVVQPLLAVGAVVEQVVAIETHRSGEHGGRTRVEHGHPALRVGTWSHRSDFRLAGR